MSEENVNVENEKSIKEIVNDLNRCDNIELSDTISLMNSDDYKKRFVAEYLQTKIRYNKLHKMLIKYDVGALEFEPACPINVLRNQKSFMGQYLYQLELRSEIENIPLPRS